MKKYKLKLNITKERIEKYVSIDEFIGVQKGDLESIRNVIPLFAMDEDGSFYPISEKETEYGTQYIAHPIPLKLIGMLTADKLMELKDLFVGRTEEEIVPPLNASDSVEPSSQEPPLPQPG